MDIISLVTKCQDLENKKLHSPPPKGSKDSSRVGKAAAVL